METIEQVVIPYMLEYEKYFNNLELWRQMVSSSVEKRPPPPPSPPPYLWPVSRGPAPARSGRAGRQDLPGQLPRQEGARKPGEGPGGGEEGAESNLRGPPISCSHTSS